VHLKFDGDYQDASGRENNASPRGPSPGFSPGKFGQAFHFNTKHDSSLFNYATLGAPPDLLFDTGDFSVSMWVNYTDQAGDPPFISNKNWDSVNNIGWGIFSQESGNFRVTPPGHPMGTIIKWMSLQTVPVSGSVGTISSLVSGADR